jgi:cytoskeletal protein CcmA (bactofilin family)
MKFRPSILPQGVRLVGNVAGDEDLVIFGTVEGEVDVGGTVIVEESGVVRGNVHGRTVSVRGIVIGDASAKESVRVEAGGSMVGDVHAPRVNIVKGAKFRGHVHMTGSDDAAGDVRSVTRRARPSTEPRSGAGAVKPSDGDSRPGESHSPARGGAAPSERAERERIAVEPAEAPIELPRERAAARERPEARPERPRDRSGERPVERSEERAIEVEDRTQSRPRRHRRRFAVEPTTAPGTVPADRSDTLAGTVFSPAPIESAPKPARSGPPLPVFPAVGRVRAQRRDGEKATDH